MYKKNCGRTIPRVRTFVYVRSPKKIFFRTNVKVTTPLRPPALLLSIISVIYTMWQETEEILIQCIFLPWSCYQPHHRSTGVLGSSTNTHVHNQARMRFSYGHTTFMLQQGTYAKIERLNRLQDFLHLFLELVSLFLEMIQNSQSGRKFFFDFS